jgi:hypothetical protein
MSEGLFGTWEIECDSFGWRLIVSSRLSLCAVCFNAVCEGEQVRVIGGIKTELVVIGRGH